jgi:DNA primase small subunit
MSEEKFTDQLKKYYQFFFPCEMLFEWLNYDKFGIKTFDGNFKFSKCREICFTHKSDKFERYRSFGSPLDMKLSIVQKNPLKIDVGPIYNFDPEMKQSYHSNIQPVERELVFDIDLNDYNDVRYCCVDSNVCNFCWPLITCAIRILDHGLRNDFGFKNILWVYSGRRGIHCWVCDYRARILSDEQRSAITEYFKIFEAGDENFSYLQGMNSSNKHHPFIEKSIELTTKYFFQHLLPKQKLLETKIKFEKILDMLPVEGHAYKRKLIKLLEGINGSKGRLHSSLGMC